MASILLGMFGTVDESPQDAEFGLSTGCPQGKKADRSTFADYLMS